MARTVEKKGMLMTITLEARMVTMVPLEARAMTKRAMLPVGRDSNCHRHTERRVRRSTNDEIMSNEATRLRPV